MQNVSKFIENAKQSIKENEFVKLILSNKRDKKNDLKAVYLKTVLLKDQLKLNFVYKHNTKDITKNLELNEAFEELQKLLETHFFQALLLSTAADFNLILRKDKSSTLKKSKATTSKKPELKHNHEKNRLIKAKNNVYLEALKVVNASGNILPKKQKKFKQINKYIEVINDVLEPIYFENEMNIVDMGAGKGYLTFALYDYLKNTANKNPKITGIELRPDLVSKCNEIAKLSEFEDLKFIEGSIQSAEIQKLDVLIALHACDTATDDAIYRGIDANAEAIIVAPCCHKQIRKQLNPTNDLKQILQFGILKERQAELLTDSLRALILETHGYKTKVFEFISGEHTPKNVLIVATKTKKPKKDISIIKRQIENIKTTFGIEYHYLEKLISGDKKYFI
ncbi:MAG: class I SAM-dependent methyltransferase [Chitinophagales bacterium]